MTDKRIKSYLEDRLKRLESIRNERELTTAELGDIACCKQILAFINSLQEEPVSENLEEACEQLAENARKHKAETSSPFFSQTDYKQGVINGAQWQKEHLWKSADGDDLPEYEREVVVFTQIFPDDAEMMMVAIGHRPNPEGWDGKSLSTGKVEHYTPKTYDKGGWNIPNVKYWLDCSIPKEIELE